MNQQTLNLSSLSQYVARILQRVPRGSVKMFGSALRGGPFEDVDLAVLDSDTSTMAFLLHHAAGAGIHPVALPKETFENLHDKLSWKNCLVTADVEGNLTYSRQYVNSDVLVFNPASRTAFPDFASARQAAAKMERRGCTVPASEKARAELHLTGNLDALVKLARETMTDEVVQLIAGHGAAVAGGFFRDEVDGRLPKDIDVFVPAGQGWGQLCDELSEILEEVDFEKPEGKRVNLRKFRARSRCPGHEALVVDVINYGFVHSTAHVVETFDFSCNTLWWDPSCPRGVQGGFGLSAAEVVQHIRNRRLVVGDNLWYRASLYRALKRWQRFRGDGYVADAANTSKYSEYVKLFSAQ